MRPIELTPRLLALARQVPEGARFADVGTDHARLPVWLLERGIIQNAIASDLREGPLEQARETARRHAELQAGMDALYEEWEALSEAVSER